VYGGMSFFTVRMAEIADTKTLYDYTLTEDMYNKAVNMIGLETLKSFCLKCYHRADFYFGDKSYSIMKDESAKIVYIEERGEK
jgi:hypothetical protein